MKLILDIDNKHIVTLQIKDPTQVTLGHIVHMVNHNLASEFRPRGYQNKNKKNFTREQLQHTLSDLGLSQSQVALKAERKLEQGQDDLSNGFLPTTLNSAILTIESITLSSRASKRIIEELSGGKVTNDYPSKELFTKFSPYFTGLTHLTLHHSGGLIYFDFYKEKGKDYIKQFDFLLQLIKNTPTRKHFEIKQTQFYPDAAIEFAIILKGQPIEYLGLPAGEIGMDGVARLIENLKVLNVLNLYYQRNGSFGNIANLIDTLERNTSLEQVIFTRTAYITPYLPLIKNMMQTNKTIISFEVTPENNTKAIADEINALGEHNAGYKALRIIFGCIPFMKKLFPSDLVFIICDCLVGRLKYNGKNLSVLEIYQKPFIKDNLAYRFFPSIDSSPEILDTDSQTPLLKLVREYESEGKIGEAILNEQYGQCAFNAKGNVETIFKLDNLNIKQMEACIAAKLRIAEKFRLLFTLANYSFVKYLLDNDTNTLESYSGVTQVLVGIEVISGDLILNGIDRKRLLSLMKILTTNINNKFYPKGLRELLTAEKSNSSLLATQSLVVSSSSSSSSSSSTSRSTAFSSWKRFLGW